MIATVNRCLILLIGSVLAACATATPYQPFTDGYGYQDQQLEDTTYRVTFTGNSDTPRSTVEDYLLYRAARITLENHYDYFVVDHQDTERSTRYFYPFSGFGGYYGSYRPFYNNFFYNPGFSTGNSSYPVSHYRASATITLHRGKKPADINHAYDAQEIMAHIGPRVRKAGAHRK